MSNTIIQALERLNRSHPGVYLPAAGICVIAIGIADHLLGSEIATSIFYHLPIIIAAWFGTARHGLLLATASAAIWLFTDLSSGSSYSHPAIAAWNALSRYGVFLIVATLVSHLRTRLAAEEEAADHDPLTGAYNSRFFHEQAEKELARINRLPRPLSVAYIDLDNFKQVNDTWGHPAGDELLRVIAGILTRSTREMDIAARLGGDEFALLLPETAANAARSAINNLQAALMAEIRRRELPVTLSIGLVTFLSPPHETQSLLKLADDLMYQVKKQGKNDILQMTWNTDDLLPVEKAATTHMT